MKATATSKVRNIQEAPAVSMGPYRVESGQMQTLTVRFHWTIGQWNRIV
jgi:hypothetical protein